MSLIMFILHFYLRPVFYVVRNIVLDTEINYFICACIIKFSMRWIRRCFFTIGLIVEVYARFCATAIGKLPPK